MRARIYRIDRKMRRRLDKKWVEVFYEKGRIGFGEVRDPTLRIELMRKVFKKPHITWQYNKKTKKKGRVTLKPGTKEHFVAVVTEIWLFGDYVREWLE